jgi:hypothetical protein
MAIYLGKSGKSYGPFSDAEYQKLLSDGKLFEYSYQWDEGKKSWRALDPAPATFLVSTGALVTYGKSGDTLLKGAMERSTETGCEWKVPSEPVALSEKQKIILVIHDVNGKKTLRKEGRIMSRERHTDGSWLYRILYKAA